MKRLIAYGADLLRWFKNKFFYKRKHTFLKEDEDIQKDLVIKRK